MAGALNVLYGSSAESLSAVCVPTVVGGTRSGAGDVTTSYTTATMTGNVGTCTFSWAYLDGDTSFTATAPSSATTAFIGHVKIGEAKDGDWRCTVTDSLGHTTTCDVFIGISETS